MQKLPAITVLSDRIMDIMQVVRWAHKLRVDDSRNWFSLLHARLFIVLQLRHLRTVIPMISFRC